MVLSIGLGVGMLMGGVSARCANGRQEQSPTLRNVEGVQVRLRLRSADDFVKDAHLCETEYEIEIVRPDGTLRESGWDNGNDAEWGRSLAFRLEGFTADERLAVGLVQEGGANPFVTVLEYALGSGLNAAFTLDKTFLMRVGKGCSQTLRVEGLNARGDVVISTTASSECKTAHAWLITERRDRKNLNVVESLPARTKVIGLRPGTLVNDPQR